MLHCPASSSLPINADTFSSLLNATRVEASGGLVVNIGAAFSPSGSHHLHSNVDHSWKFFFAHAARLNLSLVAFEGSAAFASNEKLLAGKYAEFVPRITSLNEYVSSHTIASKLALLGVAPTADASHERPPASASHSRRRVPPLQHEGQDCWLSCNSSHGACHFCGRGGACCRRGFAGSPAECGFGSIGCAATHCCVDHALP